MEALELKNRQLVDYIEGLERDLAGRMAEQVRTLLLSVITYLFIYQLFWTQACPEGMGTNGTHRSHARCHPYPIPQPVKVGHTTGVYVPYSFRTVVWVLLRPTRTDQ